VNPSNETIALGYGGLVLTVLGGVSALTLMLINPNSALRKAWARYVGELDRELRFQLWKANATRIAMAQVALTFVLLLAAIEDWIFLMLVPFSIFGPLLWLRQKHDARVRLLEEHLDSWLLMLANALKASPSLGESIESSAKLMRPPFSEELDLLIKEHKLGTPLDQAVLSMSMRIRSRIISSTLATVLVGRQTGGDLPQILEQSAATLREMARLEGVVRTKTAEGKMQAIVLAMTPFVLLFAIHQVDSHWLEPLFQTWLGTVVLILATGFWLSAIILARKILVVDI
jgi:tight adherence protein B